MTVLFAAICVFGGLLVTAYGLAQHSKSQNESLAEILEIEMADPEASPERLAELMRRTGNFADRALSKTSGIEGFKSVLARAGWSIRPGEFAAIVGVSSMVGGLVFFGLSGSLLTGAIIAGVIPPTLIAWANFTGRRRINKLDNQLPTVLQLLAGSLDSGASILHAMELVVAEGDPPLAEEFGRVVAETRVGRPLIESLQAMSQRTGSRELDWTVEAIRIQHATGGRLADTLRILADFMRSRLEIKGEVKALSAEARLSARILIALPVLVGAYFTAFKWTYIQPLFTTSMGAAMLAIAAVGMVIGTLWMRKIVKVEV